MLIGTKNLKIVEQAKFYEYRGGGITFDVLAGRTCPFAKDCKACVVETDDGLRIEKGKDTKYLCFAAKLEALRTGVYNKHKINTQLTRRDDFVQLLSREIYFSGATLFRWHWSGDFYNDKYFAKAIEIAKTFPEIYFYAYTKNAKAMIEYYKSPLKNFDIQYSMGGTQDKLAIEHKLPFATVITEKKYKYAQETDYGLPIACQAGSKYNDLEFIQRRLSFGLYVH